MWSLGVSGVAALYQIPELTTALLESKTNSVVQNQIPLQDLPDYLTLAHKNHCTLEPLLTVMVDKTLKGILPAGTNLITLLGGFLFGKVF